MNVCALFFLKKKSEHVCYIRTRTACIAQLLAQEDIISAFFYNNIISTCWQLLRDCITASKFLTQIIHTQKNKNGVVLRPVIGKLKAAGAPIFFTPAR
jgi:hypothetical protein